MKKYLSIAAMLIISLAAFAKGDIKTVVYTTTPVMHCESCENKIKGNIRFVKGVKSIVTNVPDQKVTIKYDAAKTTPQKIEAGFKKIGYTVKKLSESADEKDVKNAKSAKQ
jgi:mercuric ion binding protein